jgi:imidazole glycerol-phosphate synthase subunit HisF
MLKKRIIPVVLFSHGWLVQTENFRSFRFLGTPFKTLERLNLWGADEIIFLNISRGQKLNLRKDINQPQSSNFLNNLKLISKFINIPFSIGGKIKSFKEIEKMFFFGADKVVLNTIIHTDNNFLQSAVKKFGSQSIVVCVDLRKINGKYIPFFQDGTIKSNYKLEDWINYIQDNGAGEIMINNIDLDGSYKGYDIDLAKKILKISKIPTIFCGGAGQKEHFEELIKKTQCNAIAAANYFNFTEQSIYLLKKHLLKKKINIRKTEFYV